MTERIQRFRTINDFIKSFESNIRLLEIRSEELSKQIGEKMRLSDSNNDLELQELRQKIEGDTTDPKKKKSTKKKDLKKNWHNFESVSIYDGIGIKGELELYFKAREMIRSELDKVTKIKNSVDNLVSKGLKRDLGCVMLLNNELPAEIAFTPLTMLKRRYSFKAIFNVPLEESYEIKN